MSILRQAMSRSSYEPARIGLAVAEATRLGYDLPYDFIVLGFGGPVACRPRLVP